MSSARRPEQEPSLGSSPQENKTAESGPRSDARRGGSADSFSPGDRIAGIDLTAATSTRLLIATGDGWTASAGEAGRGWAGEPNR
jgi:hypothetical protein